MESSEKESIQSPNNNGRAPAIRRQSTAESVTNKASFFIGEGEGQKMPVKIVGPDDQEIHADDIVTPPDGGYGYVIVFAAFMTNVIVDGIVFSFGSLKDSIISAGEGTLDQATVAWVGSLLTGFYLLTGPFVSGVSNKWGFRTVAVAGSLISSTAFVISWYFNQDGPRIEILIIFYGLIGGIGFSCLYVPAVIAVGFYFEKKRALATGIAICGSGIGGFIFPPFIQMLIKNFGWQKAILVLGGTTLICAALGLLYKPLKPKRRRSSHMLPSPEGTPLLMRIKRARDMMKWDSVISFTSNRDSYNSYNDLQNPNRDDPRTRAEKLYNQARKSSAVSLKGFSPPTNPPAAAGMPKKRMSVPAMPSIAGESPQVPNNASVSVPSKASALKSKSFVGLPELHEIDEEHGSEDAGSRENSVIPQSYLAAGSAENIPKNAEGTDNNENSSLIQNRNNSVSLSYRIGNSTLTVDEMSNSRIIRVASKVTLNKPMYRDDIFYSASLLRIPDYANNVMTSMEWTAAVTRPPENEIDEEGDEAKPVSCCAACEIVRKCCGSCDVVKRMLDFSLLLSPTFVVFSVSGMFTMLGLFVPFVFLMDQAKSVLEQEGSDMVDEKKITFLISLIGAANTIGRVLSGWIADQPFVNTMILNNTAVMIMGLSTLAVPFLKTYPQFVTYSCVFGFAMSCFASLRSILVVELLGLQLLSSAFGLLLFFCGIASMLSTPLAGILIQLSGGDFAMPFYAAGGFLVFSALMCFPLSRLNQWEKKRKNDQEET